MNQSDPIAAPATTPDAATSAAPAAVDATPAAVDATPAAVDAAPAAVDAAPAAAPAAAPVAAAPAKTARIIVITSGKGGVGKTTTAASFSAGLALRGFKTAVIDFDVGLRNLDLIMGCERRVVYDLINVIHQEASLHQALIRDKNCDNLHVLPASQTRDKDALTQQGVENVLKGLQDMGFDYIICDSPAGIETGALLAMHYADEALVVTNPEVSSVRDSDRILGILASKTKRAIDGAEPIKEHLLITRYNPKRVVGGEMLSLEDIQEILRIKLIGVIPESESVLQASNQGLPAVHLNGTDVAEAYKDVISRFLGEDIPLRFTDYQKPGFFKRLFGNR
jgi:septum site-determining protein MinD